MKDMEEYYDVKLIGKSKGFLVIDCQNRWLIDWNSVKL
jgi:hypothetical protein